MGTTSRTPLSLRAPVFSFFLHVLPKPTVFTSSSPPPSLTPRNPFLHPQSALRTAPGKGGNTLFPKKYLSLSPGFPHLICPSLVHVQDCTINSIFRKERRGHVGEHLTATVELSVLSCVRSVSMYWTLTRPPMSGRCVCAEQLNVLPSWSSRSGREREAISQTNT